MRLWHWGIGAALDAQRLSDGEILLGVDHPYGPTFWVTLEEWKRRGPGLRWLMSPREAKHAATGAGLPIGTVPWKYRNERGYVRQVERRRIEPSWAYQCDRRPSGQCRCDLAFHDGRGMERPENEDWGTYWLRVWSADYERALASDMIGDAMLAVVGLVAFGSLDAMSHLCDAVGGGRSVVRAWCVPSLFPVAQAVMQHEGLGGLCEWVRSHMHRLAWDESAGEYVLLAGEPEGNC